MLDAGESLPVLRAVAEHAAEPEYEGGIWAVVDVDPARWDGRVERINITLPRRLLSQIDAYASQRGDTRSGFIAAATRAAMARSSAA
jgi:hypothetical protein